MECCSPPETGGRRLAVTDGYSCTFPVLDFLFSPILPCKDNLAWIFAFLFLCSVLLFREKRLMYLPTFSLLYFQFSIDTSVTHPYGPVFSESTYVILIRGGERGKGLMKLTMSLFCLFFFPSEKCN